MVSRQEQFEQVQAVKKSINTASEEVKNQALLAMADHLVAATEEILAANALDMAAAKGKISDVMLDRLYLDADRIEAMARGIREVVALPDPIGEVLETSQLENGLVITKKRVAMGVIGIIYESRPNVTSDAAALTLKSGNAVVLRSGKDAYQTTHAIVTALKKGLETTTIHPNVIQLVEDTSRESSYAMMKAKGYLDLLIPRGGAGLINAATGLAGCGPAFVYLFIEALADAGVQTGLPRETALKMAAQTVVGAGQLVLESQQHPGVLKDQVCSPGGSTIAGVASLEAHAFRGIVMEAVHQAYKRTQELGK
ncbi:gamma-glutamyl phosphate reductase [Streptococcus pneumoniae]|nr:gamma-glutamyl phosphate reductase [Streptococcus pneumoniae]